MIFQLDCFPSLYIVTETDPRKWQVDRRKKHNVVTEDITWYWKCKFLLTGDEKNKYVVLFLYFTYRVDQRVLYASADREGGQQQQTPGRDLCEAIISKIVAAEME